ncbi:hypothetical protein F5Y19DRAFT_459088 [Xylariaceae sp. FL1651]|nr:hypothetical protein F5Y19DRAFT_459088 [Xylariaceae sp. FL1651]
MTVAASKQLKAFLAMPTALRPVLLGALTTPRWSHSRLFSASAPQYRTNRYPNVAALLIPEFRASPITEISPDDLFKTASLPSAPGQPLEEELTKLFTKNPAAFLRAELDFYTLKKNTRIPEVCILGRSNVGKSSFINALASRKSNALAFVSSKAGRTTSINTYGFGPAPTVKELADRAAEYKGKEDVPTHAFHLLDMPGYGHRSLKEWGKEISLYLNKRSAVKGAILLIDAEVGPKDLDLHLLQLLCTAEVKTAIVLTKADKAKRGLEQVRKTCIKLWDAIHDIETKCGESGWVWEKDIFVTAVGARDSAVVSSTVTIARLAVARLAGLVKDNRPKVERNQRWSGKVVSFDDLQYADSGSSGMNTAPTAPTQMLRESQPPRGDATGLSKANSAFADLEYAARAQHSNGPRISAGLGAQSWTRTPRTHARAFYSSVVRNNKTLDGKPTPAELKVILEEFVQSLKTTNTPRDQVRRLQHKRETRPPKGSKNILKELEQRQMRKMQQQFPEQVTRTQAVLDRRLKIEEHRHRSQAAREAQAKAATEPEQSAAGGWKKRKGINQAADTEWPAAVGAPKQKEINNAMDSNVFHDAFEASSGLIGDKNEKKKKGKTPKKTPGKLTEPMDPFMAKFVQAKGKINDTTKGGSSF